MADTTDCEFEDNTKQRVAMFVIILIMVIGSAFFFLVGIICRRRNERNDSLYY